MCTSWHCEVRQSPPQPVHELCQNSVWAQLHYSTHYTEPTLHYITTSSSKIDALNVAHTWPESELTKLLQHIPGHLLHTTAALVSSAMLLNYSTHPVSSSFNITRDQHASWYIWFYLRYMIPILQDTTEQANKSPLCLLVSFWMALFSRPKLELG